MLAPGGSLFTACDERLLLAPAGSFVTACDERLLLTPGGSLVTACDERFQLTSGESLVTACDEPLMLLHVATEEGHCAFSAKALRVQNIVLDHALPLPTAVHTVYLRRTASSKVVASFCSSTSLPRAQLAAGLGSGVLPHPM
jgi:hypothetical protein